MEEREPREVEEGIETGGTGEAGGQGPKVGTGLTGKDPALAVREGHVVPQVTAPWIGGGPDQDLEAKVSFFPPVIWRNCTKVHSICWYNIFVSPLNINDIYYLHQTAKQCYCRPKKGSYASIEALVSVRCFWSFLRFS